MNKNVVELLDDLLGLSPLDEDVIGRKVNRFSNVVTSLEKDGDYHFVDDPDSLVNLLEDIAPEFRSDVFSYKGSSGDTLLHKYFDCLGVLEEIRVYRDFVNFDLTGAKKLTPLELAVNAYCGDAVQILLEMGAPVTSMRDEEMLLSISFDGRELYDIATNAGLSSEEYIQREGLYIIRTLEKYGASISGETKQIVRNMTLSWG